jgi:pimeloyl-ACP methyl ester carboxylesterase
MRDALAMVDLIAEDGPVILVASSNGGWVSTYIASVRPEKIAGLVLIGNLKTTFKSSWT